MAKSANGHNRLYVTCEEMSEKLMKAIEAGEIPFKDTKMKN